VLVLNHAVHVHAASAAS